MDGRERRQFTRVDVRIPVGLYLDSYERAEEGEILNISVGGACIQSSVELAQNDTVGIEFRFKGARLISGKIVPLQKIQEQFSSDQKDKSAIKWASSDGKMLGIEFSQLSEDKMAFIQRMVNYYVLLEKSGLTY